MRKKAVNIRASENFFNMMEKERKKYLKKGVRVSQPDLTEMIAKRLNKKQRGLGLMKNGKTKRYKKR